MIDEWADWMEERAMSYGEDGEEFPSASGSAAAPMAPFRSAVISP